MGLKLVHWMIFLILLETARSCGTVRNSQFLTFDSCSYLNESALEPQR